MQPQPLGLIILTSRGLVPFRQQFVYQAHLRRNICESGSNAGKYSLGLLNLEVPILNTGDQCLIRPYTQGLAKVSGNHDAALLIDHHMRAKAVFFTHAAIVSQLRFCVTNGRLEHI
jgi:hypothetical protein